ncbi:MAG TPA: flagellar hook-associated protein FlgK [Stellaceae bacterium]|nr:flagellar hook-associated protein FlgK [Stellaceae bacterium]
MTLGVSLSNALSGLQAAQANLTLISANIANAQTPGYSRETLPVTTQVLGGEEGGGVVTGVPQRVTDQVLNANLRKQTSVTSAASTLDSYFQRIQDMFGTVSDASALPNTLSAFSSALQTLATTPEDPVAQANAVAAGQALTTQLNSMSAGIQTLRSNADTDIGTAISTVNSLLGNIATYNNEFVHAQALGQSTASIADQRDQALQQLAQQMDITSFTRADGTVVVMTAGGKTLVDSTAETVSFTPAGTVTAASPVSGITINGIDITNDIHSGTIAALVQMRDKELPALTSELNQFANQLFNTAQVAQSTQLVSVGGGAPATGDTFQVTIDGQTFNTAATSGATVTDIVNAINGQLGATTFQASVSGGNILITDSAGKPIGVTITQTGGIGTATFTPNAPANALPTTDSGTSGAAPGDANHFFAGVNTASGVDNAGTITVNPSLLNDPSLLNGVAGTPSQTIAAALSDAIALGTPSFAAAGNFSAVTGTLSSYAGQILGQNATAASAASANSTFQTGVQNDVSTRALGVSGVNMDEELGNLQIYQTAYAASARVIQAVQSMFDALLQIQTS